MATRYYKFGLYRKSDDAKIMDITMRIPVLTAAEIQTLGYSVRYGTPLVAGSSSTSAYNTLMNTYGFAESSFPVCHQNLDSVSLDAWNYYGQYFPQFKLFPYTTLSNMFVNESQSSMPGMKCYLMDKDGYKEDVSLNNGSDAGFVLDSPNALGGLSDPFQLNVLPLNTYSYGYYRPQNLFLEVNNGNIVSVRHFDFVGDRNPIPTTNARVITYGIQYNNINFGLPKFLAHAYSMEWENPYTPEGESGPGGGDGEYDDESDENPMSSIPTTSFADAGFCRIYSPLLSEVKSLAQYMWTDTTFLQTVINHLKQLLENPMDAIISFSLVPVDLSSIRQSPVEVNVMYVPTGVYMSPVSRQFIDIDCGELKISKNIGCALDYNPYTKIHAYLPYIGQVTLDTDEVMGKTLKLRYRIDIVTGICAAFILVNGAVMYNFSGHCSISQPLTSADFSGYLNAMISAAKLVAGVAAGAGGAPEAAAGLLGGPSPRVTRTQEQALETTTARNPKTGRQITTGTDTYKRDMTVTSEGAQFGELARRGIHNTVSSVMNSKLIVEHTSGFSGNSGYLAQREPFVIIERPRLCNPKEYGHYNGFPSMMYLNLSDCTGYTEVQQIQLTGFNATNPELSEISELLKSGVVL